VEKIRDLGILIIYCALIFYLSSQSRLPLEQTFLNQDKLLHVAAYAVMGLLAWRSFRHFVQEKPALALCCIGFCGLYGLSDEVHQFYVPGRSASPYDLIADIVGAMVSVLLIRFFKPALIVLK
jgi:VanZ family protein